MIIPPFPPLSQIVLKVPGRNGAMTHRSGEFSREIDIALPSLFDPGDRGGHAIRPDRIFPCYFPLVFFSEERISLSGADLIVVPRVNRGTNYEYIF
jgi:hypothetical protein